MIVFLIPFGLRSAAYICQRTTNAIIFLFRYAGYFGLNYLDDIGGVDTPDKANTAFSYLQNLFDILGVDEAKDKAVPPTHEMVFLGILFNTLDMTMSVPQKKWQKVWKY